MPDDRSAFTVAGPLAVFAAVAAFFGAGCSNPAPTPSLPNADELSAGTAQIRVNGKDLGVTHAVNCHREGSTTSMTTGGPDAGINVVVDNSRGLVTKSVTITDLGGFTGSYWEDLDGQAQVRQSGRTLLVTGTAFGFATDEPNRRSTGTFSIRLAC